MFTVDDLKDNFEIGDIIEIISLPGVIGEIVSKNNDNYNYSGYYGVKILNNKLYKDNSYPLQKKNMKMVLKGIKVYSDFSNYIRMIELKGQINYSLIIKNKKLFMELTNEYNDYTYERFQKVVDNNRNIM